MKRIFVMLSVLCLLLGLSVTAFAADSAYIRDDADLLTAEEELQLSEYIEQIAQEYDCGVYVVTVESYLFHETTPQKAAEALYIQQTAMGNVPRDGMLLMLSMIERDYSLITYGEYAAAVFTDDVMWSMEDRFLTEFAVNDWVSGFCSYIGDAEAALDAYNGAAAARYGDGYVSYYEPGVPDVLVRFYRVPSELWVVVIIGSMAVALIVCLVMKAGMNTAREKSHASEYIPAGGVELRVKQDLFTHTTRQVIHHPKSDGGSSGGGSGGFRGHSGKF